MLVPNFENTWLTSSLTSAFASMEAECSLLWRVTTWLFIHSTSKSSSEFFVLSGDDTISSTSTTMDSAVVLTAVVVVVVLVLIVMCVGFVVLAMVEMVVVVVWMGSLGSAVGFTCNNVTYWFAEVVW